MSDPMTPFARFVRNVHARMRKGQKEYGDKSWSSHPLDLIREMKEEVLDIAGWGFILYERLENLEHRVSALALEELDEADTDGQGVPGASGED